MKKSKVKTEMDDFPGMCQSGMRLCLRMYVYIYIYIYIYVVYLFVKCIFLQKILFKALDIVLIDSNVM